MSAVGGVGAPAKEKVGAQNGLPALVCFAPKWSNSGCWECGEVEQGEQRGDSVTGYIVVLPQASSEPATSLPLSIGPIWSSNSNAQAFIE